MSERAGDAIVHFSGGSDSTLCAAMLAESHERVHLLTYDRFSFIGARRHTEHNYERLCRIYGPDRFVRRIVPIGAAHKRICYGRYFRTVARYGLAAPSLAFSKLAMHWFSSVYALRHGIPVVADGAVPYMSLYPDQNSSIALGALGEFYTGLGIRYLNPVYDMADSVEDRLYDKGLSLQPLVRGTERDTQVYYVEQVILALFLKYYVTVHGREGYEKAMASLFRDRIELMTEGVRTWQRNPRRSFLQRILEKVS